MKEQVEKSLYEVAVEQFKDILHAEPYSPTAILTCLTEVQTTGVVSGLEPKILFSDLVSLAGSAAQRAAESSDEANVKTFSVMQKGYKAAQKRLTPSQEPAKTPRSRSGVAAG